METLVYVGIQKYSGKCAPSKKEFKIGWPTFRAVFKIKLRFCVPVQSTAFETIVLEVLLCCFLICSNGNSQKTM